MARWRRPGVNEILLAYLLLAAIGCLCSWLSHTRDQSDPLWSFLVTAFFAWRVSRGGRIARMLLILDNGASYAEAALDVARLWNVVVVTLLVVAAAQVALLVSTPVYWHTRQTPVTVRVPGWAPFVGRPPAWLLPWGLLAGVLVTLACLGHMDATTIAGCRVTAGVPERPPFSRKPVWKAAEDLGAVVRAGEVRVRRFRGSGSWLVTRLPRCRRWCG